MANMPPSSFANARNTNTHKKQKKKTEWECVSCSATFRSKEGLQNHQSFAHGVKIWVCFECSPPKSFSSSLELERHKRDNHLYKCSHCRASFPSKGARKRHNKESHTSKEEENPDPPPPPATEVKSVTQTAVMEAHLR